MPTLIITVDLECCRCSSKIQKILCCIQERGEFVIDKIVYEKDKVVVSGPFDADNLSWKLRCKASRIIKIIEVATPPPPTPPPPPPPEPKQPAPCKLIPYPYPYQPYPCPQPAWPCSCPTLYCQCHSKQLPGPAAPACPCCCPTPYCQCHAKPPAPAPAPPAAPTPPKPLACQCPTWPSASYMPPPIPYPFVVCEDNQPYGACAVM